MTDLDAVVKGMMDGQYQLVIIENVNPAFTLPENSNFKKP